MASQPTLRPPKVVPRNKSRLPPQWLPRSRTLTNIDNASTTKLAQLKDDDVVEVTVDGEPVQMSWKDAKGGVMRQSHYTKSMQQLRTEQSQFESQRQALAQDSENLQVLRNVLTNQDLLKQFVAKQFPSLAPGPTAVARSCCPGGPERPRHSGSDS
jgi:hypothetical protein